MESIDPKLYSLIRTVMLNSENLSIPEPQKVSKFVFYDMFKILSETKEFDELLNYLQALEELKIRLLRISSSTESSLKRMIQRFHSEFESNSMKIDGDKFQELYHDFENFVYGKSVYRYYALTDWQVDEQVQINNMSIKMANTEEIKEYFPQELELLALSKHQKYSLVEISRTDIESFRADKMFGNLVTVLNLFKCNYGRIYTHTSKMPKFYPVEHTIYYFPHIRRSQINYNNPELKSYEVENFVSFFHFFNELRKPRVLEQSINRFELGMQAAAFEDKILDFVISLECLFGEDKELIDKIANRTALLLGKNEFDTECIRVFIRNVYNVRSGIVHGGNYIKKTDLPLEFIRIKLTILVNMAILAHLSLLKQEKTMESIKKELNQSISSPRLRDELQSLISMKF